MVNTPRGAVPLGHMVTRTAEPRTGDLIRVDSSRTYTISADVEEGVLADSKVGEVRAWLAAQPFDPEIRFNFRGEDEEQAAAQAFLGRAFGIALFLIAMILLLQFNSFYEVFLILSAIVFSTVGVFLGLLIVDQPFGIIMSGIGVIALAGIVVSNNIVLIDTYNELRGRGMEPDEAVLRTGAQRIRPVLLTAFNGVLGLLPLVFKINVDLIDRAVIDRRPIRRLVAAAQPRHRLGPDLRHGDHAGADAVPADPGRAGRGGVAAWRYAPAQLAAPQQVGRGYRPAPGGRVRSGRPMIRAALRSARHADNPARARRARSCPRCRWCRSRR